MHVSRPAFALAAALVGYAFVSAAPVTATPVTVKPVTAAPGVSSGPSAPAVAATPPARAVAAYDDDAESQVAALPSSDGFVPDFGRAPSGSVPILFNDRHVYAKPDKIVRGRLLAAIVRNGTILVPMRSLFMQLGAAVSYDAATKTTTARRGATEISIVVGRPSVDIDGVTRPLDVPPELVGSTVLVPVRVIAEVFGAYVQWLPDKHAVAVRYLASTAVAPAAPPATPVPLAIATALPTPRPRQTVGPGAAIPKPPITNETYIAIDPIVDPRVANEFAPNVIGGSGTSFVLRGVDEFNLFGGEFALSAEYTKNHYAHSTSQVTLIGHTSAIVIPAFIANDYALNVNFGVQLSPEKYYFAASYETQTGNYGYPRIGGFGIGIDKQPVLDRKISYEGAFFYYPNISGTCATACPTGPFTPTYKYFRYDAGLTALLGHKVFVEAGYQGDKGIMKADAPATFTHSGPVGGMGVRF